MGEISLSLREEAPAFGCGNAWRVGEVCGQARDLRHPDVFHGRMDVSGRGQPLPSDGFTKLGFLRAEWGQSDKMRGQASEYGKSL